MLRLHGPLITQDWLQLLNAKLPERFQGGSGFKSTQSHRRAPCKKNRHCRRPTTHSETLPKTRVLSENKRDKKHSAFMPSISQTYTKEPLGPGPQHMHTIHYFAVLNF